MLVKLVIDNFLSFEAPTEMTMIASNKTQKKEEHLVKVQSTSILRYSVIYGANASGKSNLIEAFRFIKYCVGTAIPANAKNMFCRTKEENSKKESMFELQLSIGDKFYAYGFSVLLSGRQLISEWLYELYQNGSSKCIFERQGNNKPEIGERFRLYKGENHKMQTYLDDFDEASNELFLSFMNKGKKYTDNSKIKIFQDLYNGIVNGIDICCPDTSLTGFEYYYDDTSISKVNELIRTFDTGISEVVIEEIDEDELKQNLQPIVYSELMLNIKKKLESGLDKFRISLRSHHNFYSIEGNEGQIQRYTTIKLKHGHSYYDFDYGEESDGTRRLFEFLDILLTKEEDKVFVIDEMERSLHPKMTYRFVELFEELHPNQRIQLIFTTHESSIMDQALFRRDEIWFVERDHTNCSQIYSLDRFKERYDKKISKAYLEGRYGAIPVFSAFGYKED